jgi:Cu-processing system permease protein
MRTIGKIVSIQLHDLLRGKWVLIYTLALILLVEGLFRLGGDAGQVSVSMMNLVLIIVPLVSIIFGVMFFYNSRDFVVLLLSQPISRSQLYLGLYVGVSLPLSAVFLLGIGTPFFYHEGFVGLNWSLLFSGVMLTWIFVSIAFLIAVINPQRVRGVGMAIVTWLFFSVIYDGIILFILFALQDYPLDALTITLSVLNPVDMGRILMLLQIDISALMGYTGALFSKFLGENMGVFITIGMLTTWCLVPVWLGHRAFSRRDV